MVLLWPFSLVQKYMWYIKCLSTQVRLYVARKSKSFQWISCSVLTPYRCSWWGPCISTPLSVLGPLWEEQYRQTKDLKKKVNLHSPAVLLGRFCHPSHLSDLILLTYVVFTSHSKLCLLGLVLLLLHKVHLVCTAGVVHRHHVAWVLQWRCFGLCLEAQLIQACFDKAKCVCCEKHLHSKL